ncbi:hypothetical protein G6F20_012009 [Rhizopus arrhizus]|nr:hypothetical protein G6F20_012009 [Rhizopus arrhizus]
MQRFQLGCAVQPYTGDSEHKSRSTESIETSSIRSGTTTPIIQHDSRPMGSSDDRRFCGKAQHKNKEVLESTSRSGCSSSGRVPPEMAEEGTLLTSTVENDPKGNSQVSTVEDQQRSIGDAILVPNDPKNETLDTTATDEHQQLDSGRMALIYKSGIRDSINDKTTTFLLKATRQSTHKAYNNGWKVWSNWCRSQNPKLEPEEYSPNNVLQFLVDNQHFSYQYLNGLRSSIASVFKHIHPHQKPIASQPNISRFFTAKRKTEIRIPTTSQLETWDINLLIQFIKDKLSPTAELNLQRLQLKVILLTCINTMGRPRSDVGRLQHRDVKFITSEISSDLEGVVLRIRTPEESQFKTSKLGMVDDKEVCLVSTLFVFMHKTKGCRVHLPEDHTLFLSYIQHHTKPPSSVRTATVGKWIHEAMKEAGVNPVFKAHSIRSASSTKAVMLGTPIDKVKEHANWSLKSNTFEKYYYKPHQRLHQSTAIQNSIFLSAEKRITLEVEAESTGIVLGTTNNTKVDEAKTENVIHTRPWYRKYF